ISIITGLGFASSNGEARRLIQQGGVSLDDVKVTDVQAMVSLEKDQEVVLKAGKRKFAILAASDPRE
ncbi:MAG: tyrosine--tRNA ligase, partial [Rhodothermaeota bacterium MED-G64]